MKFSNDLQGWLITIGIIVFGAIVHATMQFKIARDRKEKFTWADAFIFLVFGLFSGMVANLFANAYFTSDWIIGLVTSTGAAGGLAFFSKISEQILDTLVKLKK